MPYTLTHDPEQDIGTVTFNGTISPADLLASSADAVALQKAKGTLLYLIDSEDWDLGASVVDLYQLPTREYGRADLDRRTRIAIVRPGNANALEGAHFYESACRNRGWNARIHPDRASAVAWLKAS